MFCDATMLLHGAYFRPKNCAELSLAHWRIWVRAGSGENECRRFFGGTGGGMSSSTKSNSLITSELALEDKDLLEKYRAPCPSPFRLQNSQTETMSDGRPKIRNSTSDIRL